MKTTTKAILGALMFAGASFAASTPASAYVDVGISFGWDGPITGFEPCDYYDYYDEAPPWGLPEDYCDYPVYFEPVYFDGYWYRGPIYYRWWHGRRAFWLNGGWREDSWRGGPRPARITWRSHGGPNHGFRSGFRGHDWRGGDRRWHDNGGHDRNRDRDRDRDGRDHDRRPFTGGDRPWSGRQHDGGFRGNDHPHDGFGGGDRGDRGRDRGDRGDRGHDRGNGGSHFGGGDHGDGGHHGGGDGGSHFGGGDHGGGGHHNGGDHGGGNNHPGGGHRH